MERKDTILFMTDILKETLKLSEDSPSLGPDWVVPSHQAASFGGGGGGRGLPDHQEAREQLSAHLAFAGPGRRGR